MIHCRKKKIPVTDKWSDFTLYSNKLDVKVLMFAFFFKIKLITADHLAGLASILSMWYKNKTKNKTSKFTELSKFSNSILIFQFLQSTSVKHFYTSLRFQLTVSSF